MHASEDGRADELGERLRIDPSFTSAMLYTLNHPSMADLWKTLRVSDFLRAPTKPNYAHSQSQSSSNAPDSINAHIFSTKSVRFGTQLEAFQRSVKHLPPPERVN
jgi:hypothetical protein